MKFLTWIFIFLLMACATSEVPKQQRQVECKYWLQQCHLKAREFCRSGYSVVRSTRVDRIGGPQGAYKAYKMLFTCN